MKRAVLILGALIAPLVVRGQSPIDSSADRLGMRATELWAGYSARSSKWGVLGNRPGLSFGVAAGRLAYRIKSTPRYALDYTIDFVPVALSSPPLAYIDEQGNPQAAPPPGECKVSVFGCRFPNGSAYGTGVSPFGVTAVYRRAHAFQPRIGITGGALLFDRKVPTVISTEFNFTATLEAGAQWLTKKGDGVLLVYRFHHLSNAGMGNDNSALASHVISLGARLRSR